MALAFKDHGGFSSFKIPYETDLLDFHAYKPDRYPFLLESHQLHQPNDGSDIFWPGYVDATTNLILNFLFLLTLLMVAVFMFALELGRSTP